MTASELRQAVDAFASEVDRYFENAHPSVLPIRERVDM